MKSLAQRQRLFWLSFALALSLALAACGARPELPSAASDAPAAEESSAAAETTTEETAAAADTDSDKEAPMLAEMVAAGELPPLEERLPAEPLVVEPCDSLGEYGGTWHRAFRGVKDFHAWGRINYDPVLRWAPELRRSDPAWPGQGVVMERRGHRADARLPRGTQVVRRRTLDGG